MGTQYAVIGAGRQGTASAYDLAVHGNATRILMIDSRGEAAKTSASRINRLTGHKIAESLKLDVQNQRELDKCLQDIDGLISAVPFRFNLRLTESAIRTQTHMTDMGGNADVVSQQMKLHSKARSSGITVIPDCGMGPGMTGSLAAYGISKMDKALDVYIWDGGLPQKPESPWNFSLTFDINGLTNEYDGLATFLRDGRVVKIPCFSEYELIDFPPLGQLEAFVTSGGSTTAVKAFKGKLRTYQNKTLRYIGHSEQFKTFQRLGLFSEEPVFIQGKKVVPRDFFHALLEPKLNPPDNYKDICLIRILIRGLKNDTPHEFTIELVDKYDKMTDFTAMERLTGFHSAIIVQMSVRGLAKRGVVPLEKAVDPDDFISEALSRGFKITENWNLIKGF